VWVTVKGQTLSGNALGRKLAARLPSIGPAMWILARQGQSASAARSSPEANPRTTSSLATESGSTATLVVVHQHQRLYSKSQ